MVWIQVEILSLSYYWSLEKPQKFKQAKNLFIKLSEA